MGRTDIDFEAGEAEETADRPQDSLDVYDKVASPGVDDEFLRNNNLGLGVYGDREYWQQVESYERGLFADAAFTRRLRERAVAETKTQLAINGWDGPDGQGERSNGHDDSDLDTIMHIVETHQDTESSAADLVRDIEAEVGHDLRGWEDLSAEERAEADRRRFVEERGERIWKALNERERVAAVKRYAGLTAEWRPPQWRMLEMRHEASRSRGSRLLDNIFSRVEEVKQDVSEAARDTLLGGGGR